MLFHRLLLMLFGFALISAFQPIFQPFQPTLCLAPHTSTATMCSQRNAANVRKICAPQSVCQRGPKYSCSEFVHQTSPNWCVALWWTLVLEVNKHWNLHKNMNFLKFSTFDTFLIKYWSDWNASSGLQNIALLILLGFDRPRRELLRLHVGMIALFLRYVVDPYREGRQKIVLLCHLNNHEKKDFYRTQVYLGSDLWVQVSLTYETSG